MTTVKLFLYHICAWCAGFWGSSNKTDGMSITGAGILRYGRRLRQTQDGRVSPIFTETGRMVWWFRCKLDCTSKVSFTRHLRREELWHHSDTAATSVSGCCRSVYRVLYLVVDPICIAVLNQSEAAVDLDPKVVIEVHLYWYVRCCFQSCRWCTSCLSEYGCHSGCWNV